MPNKIQKTLNVEVCYMYWSEICKRHPNKWLVVEALEAHTTSDYQRQLNRLTVVSAYNESYIRQMKADHRP